METRARSGLDWVQMAAPPPRPSARNAGARAGAGAPHGEQAGGGAGPARASAGHSGSGKGDKTVGTFFLGRYRVVEEIGIGGMASVHLARMDGPGGFQKWVAIKRIHPNLVEDDQFVDMFLDEARIAAGINHANVAQVFDLGKDEGTYWIAMEYLHGEPLRELMRRCEERNQTISCDIAARVCADAAEGLHAAHELRGKNNQLLGLVHRDVTPHNLFITYDGYTKVVDFGIAKVADRLSETRAGTLKGKLAYMSPEQVRGQDDVDRTTDIFALGVVLWELTTGHRLFRMDTDLDTLEKVQACVVPPPSTIVPGYPIELESVVMKALAKKKPERYQTARELSRSLQLYLQRRGVLIGPEEVSSFVRDMFADRIKAREAHLAWAADVTSTINIDQLNAMKAGRSAEKNADRALSMPDLGQSHRDSLGGGAGRDSQLDSRQSDAPRTIAISADHGKPSLPGSNVPPIRPSSNGVADPNAHGHGAPPPPSRKPPPPPPPTVPHSPAAKFGTGPMAAVGAPPTPGPPPASGGKHRGAGMTSLVDDDEDIPTTVATHAQVRDLPPQGPPQKPRGNQLPSVRATAMGIGAAVIPGTNGAMPPGADANGHNQHAPELRGLGSTIALAPGQAPTFGPPPGPSQPGYGPQGFQSGGFQPPGSQGFNPQGFGQPQQGASGPFSQQHQHPQAAAHQQQQQQQYGQPAFGPPPQGGGQPGSGPFSYPGAGGFGPPPNPSGTFQALNGAPPSMPGPQGGAQSPPRPPPSAIETALSLPRPAGNNPLWGPAAGSKHSERMSTAVLVAVAVLTAICVLALGALIYFRYRAAPAAPGGATEAPRLDARG